MKSKAGLIQQHNLIELAGDAAVDRDSEEEVNTKIFRPPNAKLGLGFQVLWHTNIGEDVSVSS
jgi:hypothetical protein